MKKLIVLAIIVIAIVFTSCSTGHNCYARRDCGVALQHRLGDR